MPSNMPAEKRRKSKTPENVPQLGDPDRKRVLNVLAQRRYRMSLSHSTTTDDEQPNLRLQVKNEKKR